MSLNQKSSSFAKIEEKKKEIKKEEHRYSPVKKLGIFGTSTKNTMKNPHPTYLLHNGVPGTRADSYILQGRYRSRCSNTEGST